MEEILQNRHQLAQNIRAERARCGFTQEKVAEFLNITSNQYKTYETSGRIDSVTLFRLSQIFDCPITLFFLKMKSTESLK